MHFENAKDDTGHYHRELEIRDDNGLLVGAIRAGRAGVTITAAQGWRLRQIGSGVQEDGAVIGIEANQ